MRSRSLIARLIARLLIAVLTIALCTTADLVAYAQQVQLPPASVLEPAPPAAGSSSALPDAPSAAKETAVAQQTQPEVVPVGPEQSPAPEQPAETQPQPASENTQPPANTTPVPARSEQPLGTAAAEKGTTRGGAASKPAGVAIAPAKQKRSKSFLIKLGAVAAGAAALGAVYVLTRSTSSTPPGAVR
jgi:hypothetical protein